MALTAADLVRLGRLARLRLTPEEAAQLAPQFQAILGLIDQLQAVDTTGVEPLAHALDLEQPLRPDVVTESDQRARFAALAPALSEGLYMVPQVIE